MKGMTKRTKFIKADPPPPPPSLGDIVWYCNGQEAWHTGCLQNVIERGKSFGMLKIRDAVTGRIVTALPEHVRGIAKRKELDK